MFKNKNMDLLSNKVTELNNSQLELIELVRSIYESVGTLLYESDTQRDVYIEKLDNIQQLAYDNKSMLEKKTGYRKVEKRHNAVNRENPFINRKREQPLVVAIEDRNYTVKEMAKMFNVSNVVIINRLARLRKVLGNDFDTYFYKKDNGYKDGNTIGKKWIITSEGAKVIVKTFDMEVI